jgi:hypothetical protein
MLCATTGFPKLCGSPCIAYSARNQSAVVGRKVVQRQGLPRLCGDATDSVTGRPGEIFSRGVARPPAEDRLYGIDPRRVAIPAIYDEDWPGICVFVYARQQFFRPWAYRTTDRPGA